ncbi:MAG: DinB family protein [Pyrinomonadaceae bacterium]
MYSVDHLRHLFEYNDWANRRMIVSLKENDSKRSLELLAHLLITEKEYFERFYGKDSTGFDFWPQMNIQECSAQTKDNAVQYEKLLKRFDDEAIGMYVKYKTSEGIPYENTFREMLSHVLIHSSTHRGNIMLKLREEGFEPPKIDYIIYLRETKYV